MEELQKITSEKFQKELQTITPEELKEELFGISARSRYLEGLSTFSEECSKLSVLPTPPPDEKVAFNIECMLQMTHKLESTLDGNELQKLQELQSDLLVYQEHLSKRIKLKEEIVKFPASLKPAKF